MADLIQWIETNGGPHLLGPIELLSAWRGCDGWQDNGPDDPSDYARACRIDGFLGLITCGDGNLVVLSGEVGSTAWFPNSNPNEATLVTWVGCDSEDHIRNILTKIAAGQPVPQSHTEIIEFETGQSGWLVLFDAADSGSTVADVESIVKLGPGRYTINASYIDTDTCMMVLREIKPVSYQN